MGRIAVLFAIGPNRLEGTLTRSEPSFKSVYLQPHVDASITSPLCISRIALSRHRQRSISRCAFVYGENAYHTDRTSLATLITLPAQIDIVIASISNTHSVVPH
jgi:hypothetical protein